jgi:hypothetical protein
MFRGSVQLILFFCACINRAQPRSLTLEPALPHAHAARVDSRASARLLISVEFQFLAVCAHHHYFCLVVYFFS